MLATPRPPRKPETAPASCSSGSTPFCSPPSSFCSEPGAGAAFCFLAGQALQLVDDLFGQRTAGQDADLGVEVFAAPIVVVRVILVEQVHLAAALLLDEQGAAGDIKGRLQLHADQCRQQHEAGEIVDEHAPFLDQLPDLVELDAFFQQQVLVFSGYGHYSFILLKDALGDKHDVEGLQDEVLAAAAQDVLDVDMDLFFDTVLIARDQHLAAAGAVAEAAGLGDGAQQGDLVGPLFHAHGAGVLDLAENVDVEELAAGDVDDVAGENGDVVARIGPEQDIVELDDQRQAGDGAELAEDDHRGAGLFAQAAGHRNDLQQALAADQVDHARVLDRAHDRYLLALELLDENGHLGVFQEALFQQGGDPFFQLEAVEALGLDLAQQRQVDHAVLRNAHRNVQLGHFEDGDLQQVLGADLVFVGLAAAGVGLGVQDRRESVLVLVIVLVREKSHISLILSCSPHAKFSNCMLLTPTLTPEFVLKAIGNKPSPKTARVIQVQGIGTQTVDIVGKTQGHGAEKGYGQVIALLANAVTALQLQVEKGRILQAAVPVGGPALQKTGQVDLDAAAE